ncbi:threonine-phosphate decarboxylase [Anabaena sp. FACHB-1237]|uniref:threonine-phosphate decarboxylase CobD n=1 Tax=Anabaena sp. FACHB-1237 TaxID=2692769 RepID=UPI001681B9A4|nr:threonine-phosphate decarboxylase CobD [Anabaena sp. FACHB-1237]MBD2138394.1 threonine-phosphate decarboxylase [Anabaena sp. FACHB-1237]
MQEQAHGGNLSWAAALAGCPPDAILDFSASISPLGPPDSVITAITSELGNLRNYPDPDYSDLRLALSHFHQIHQDCILPGNGSAELLTLVGRDLASLSATVLVTPAFGDYYRALQAYDARVLSLSVDLTTDLLINFNVHPRIGVSLDINREESGLLINNPHNPTGKLFVWESIVPYLEQFALVVVDEAFMDFVPPEQEQSMIALVEEYENLVVLRSLTKFYSLAGLRLGYAIAHPDRLATWKSWRDPWPVNTLAVAAAIAALKDIEYQVNSWEWLPTARKFLFDGLSSLPGLKPIPGAANYLLVESEYSTVELQRQLLQRYQILIRDCASFKELGDRYFRVAVRSQLDHETLLTALHFMTRNRQ